MILPALLAKFLSAGAVAQAATGAGVVVVAFTGVGAVGALPAAAQDSFSTVVAAVTPLTPPTSEGTAEEPAEDAVPEASLAEDGETAENGETAEDGTAEGAVEPGSTEAEEFDVAAWALTGPEGYDSHGAWVTASAQNSELRAALKAKGVSFGAVISGWANGNGVDPDVLAALGVESDEPADEQPVEVAPVAPVVEPTDGGGGSVAVVAESGARGNSGKQAPQGKQGQAKSQGQAKGNGGGNGRGNG